MPFLSQVLGRPVLDPDGSSVGTLTDLLVRADIPYPPVSAAVVKTGRREVAVPWDDISSVSPRGTVLRRQFNAASYRPPGDDMIWLSRDVLDKQIVDTAGIRLVRVNDLSLVPINDELRLAGVDASTTGLLRRLGVDWLARAIGRAKVRLIDWEQVDVGPAIEEVRLTVPFDRLRRMRPADIAAVVSQMSAGTAADVLEALQEETAAAALAELSEEHGAAVLAAMEPAEAADVLDEMPPDEAADVLGDIPEERAEELLRLMEPAAAARVRSLLGYEERSAGGLMNSRLITVGEHETVGHVIERLREQAPPEDEMYNLCVVDDEGHLRGTLTPRDLILADWSAEAVTVMNLDPVFVNLDDPEEEVARKLVHYDLLAAPVVDEEGVLKGAVTISDVMDDIVPRAWRAQPRRMLG